MTRPILYSFRRCPYAMRARLALLFSKQNVELREIVLRNKPASMLEASPKGTVPVLIQGNEQVLEESLDIALWALEENDPADLLNPKNGTKKQMLDLIEHFDGPFKSHLDKYKYANRYAEADQDSAVFAAGHRDQAMALLGELESLLKTQAYLFGETLSLADIAIAPFVRQFANTDREWFDQQPCPDLHRWLNTFLDSAEFQTIMEKYTPWEAETVGVSFPPSYSV